VQTFGKARAAKRLLSGVPGDSGDLGVPRQHLTPHLTARSQCCPSRRRNAVAQEESGEELLRTGISQGGKTM